MLPIGPLDVVFRYATFFVCHKRYCVLMTRVLSSSQRDAYEERRADLLLWPAPREAMEQAFGNIAYLSPELLSNVHHQRHRFAPGGTSGRNIECERARGRTG